MADTYLRDDELTPEELYRFLQNERAAEAIQRELQNPSSPFSEMIGRARVEFIEALDKLIGADLYQDSGIATARQAQNDAKRFLDLQLWIAEAISTGEAASFNLAGHYQAGEEEA